MAETSILIIGDADTGKTHYGVQLMLRLEAAAGSARYFRAPENVTPFREAMKAVNSGRSASHTTGEQTETVALPIEFTGQFRASVEWPEYAGERLTDLLRHRCAGDTWSNAAKRADAWMLFVRLDKFTRGRDMLSRPVAPTAQIAQAESRTAAEWLPQAQQIELLQMMLFLRRASCRTPLSIPRLAIALSLYDTVPDALEGTAPLAIFRNRTPLLASFIEANWAESSRFCVGVSALGKPLSSDEADDDFADSGPAENGWIVRPDGTKDSDLTWPLLHLLKNN